MKNYIYLIILVLLYSCVNSNQNTKDISVKNEDSTTVEKENVKIRPNITTTESNSMKIKSSPVEHKHLNCDTLNIEVLDSLLPLIENRKFNYSWNTIKAFYENSIHLEGRHLDFLLTDVQIKQSEEYNARYFLVGKMYQIKNHFAVVLIIETHIFFQVECIIYNFDGDRCKSFTLALVGGDYEGSRISSGRLIDSLNYKMTTIYARVVNDSIERVDSSYHSVIIDNYCNHD